jgi:hypothetical protein
MSAARSENHQRHDVPALLRTIETFSIDTQHLRADNARLLAENDRLTAEAAERDAPIWMTLQRAAHTAGCTYDRAAAFARRAVTAGRLNEARKVGGRVSINVRALMAYLMQ